MLWFINKVKTSEAVIKDNLARNVYCVRISKSKISVSAYIENIAAFD